MTSKFLLHLMKTVCSKKRFSSISTQHLRILSCLMLDLVLKMNWAWCPFSAPPLYHVSLRAQDFYIISTLKWLVYILSPLPHHVEKVMAPHSSTLAWKISWMEDPGGPQSMGSLRVRHDWATSRSLFTFMHWRRKWQPTPVSFPGESQGRGSLVGCHLWGRTESDMTEAT